MIAVIRPLLHSLLYFPSRPFVETPEAAEAFRPPVVDLRIGGIAGQRGIEHGEGRGALAGKVEGPPFPEADRR